jgi:hypothetical protein
VVQHEGDYKQAEVIEAAFAQAVEEPVSQAGMDSSQRRTAWKY